MELQEWENAVFLAANNFRVLLYGEGRSHEAEAHCESFPEAMQLTAKAQRNGKRVLIYAISPEGRSVCLHQKSWNHYARLWLSAQGGARRNS